MGWTRAVLGIGAVFLAGCGPREIVTSIGHVEYFEIEGQPRPCAGNAAFLNSVAERFSAYLGLSIDAPLKYHYRPSGTELPCPTGAFGCTNGTSAEMWARNPDEAHELVHALLAQHHITTTPFLAEGLALALGDDLSVGVLRPAPSIDALLEQRDALAYSPDELVSVALVSAALLRRGGPQSLLRALRAVSPGSSAGASKQALNEAFEFDFDAFVDDLRDAGAQPTHLALRECAAPPGALEGTLQLSCSDNAAGPVAASSPPTMYVSHTLSLTAPGAYAVRVTGGSAETAVFWRLTDCESGARPATQGVGGPFFANSRLLLKYVQTSAWALSAVSDESSDNQLVFETSRTDAGAVSGCTGAPMTIDASIESIDFDVRDEVVALWALRSETDRVATLGPTMAVELCSDACGASCSRHDGAGEELQFKAGVTLWLRPLVSSSIGFSSLR
jgi:hypothetical protein